MDFLAQIWLQWTLRHILLTYSHTLLIFVPYLTIPGLFEYFSDIWVSLRRSNFSGVKERLKFTCIGLFLGAQFLRLYQDG